MGSCSSSMTTRPLTRSQSKNSSPLQRCQDLPQLHEELWLAILQRVPERNVLDSCVLVCKAWHRLCTERTAKEVVLEHCDKCAGCGARSWPVTELECRMNSFLSYLERRLLTVEKLVLCPSRIKVQDLTRLCEKVMNCPRLTYLEINSGNGVRLNTDMLLRLPTTLEVLVTSLDTEAWCHSVHLRRLTNLTTLELGQRESLPPCPNQMQEVCRLTSLRQLTLHARRGCLIPDEISLLTNLELLEIEALPEFTLRHMSALMQLRKLELLILRDLFSLREPLDTLSQHPSLQDILIQCTAASKEGSMSVFRLPKVSVFRCSGFQYEVPSEVEAPGTTVSQHLMQSLSLTLHTAALDLAALLAAPQLSSLELRCHQLRLVNLGHSQAAQLIAKGRRLDCVLACATEMSRGDQRRLRKAGFKIEKHTTGAGPQWIAQYYA